jgi:hypothetical protein
MIPFNSRTEIICHCKQQLSFSVLKCNYLKEFVLALLQSCHFALCRAILRQGNGSYHAAPCVPPLAAVFRLLTALVIMFPSLKSFVLLAS